jgi:hypothetical protein
MGRKDDSTTCLLLARGHCPNPGQTEKPVYVVRSCNVHTSNSWLSAILVLGSTLVRAGEGYACDVLAGAELGFAFAMNSMTRRLLSPMMESPHACNRLPVPSHAVRLLRLHQSGPASSCRFRKLCPIDSGSANRRILSKYASYYNEVRMQRAATLLPTRSSGRPSARLRSWRCIHRFRPRRFPNSSPIPRPIPGKINYTSDGNGTRRSKQRDVRIKRRGHP